MSINNMGKIKNKYKRYSKEEKEYILRYASSYTVEQLAQKMKRPASSLRLKMIELGCYSISEYDGTYSASSLAEFMGVSHETVRRWIRKGLPVKRQIRHENTKIEQSIYQIQIDDFWKWAKENQETMTFAQADLLLLAPAPNWAKEKQKQDARGPQKQKKWTKQEDERLLFLLFQCDMIQKEAAHELNRTPSSIEKRLKRIQSKK